MELIFYLSNKRTILYLLLLAFYNQFTIYHTLSNYAPFFLLSTIFSPLIQTFLTICVSLYRRQCGERTSPEEARPWPCWPPLRFQWVSGGFWKSLEWILSIAGDWKLRLLVPHKQISGIWWCEQWARAWIDQWNYSSPQRDPINLVTHLFIFFDLIY